MPFAAELPLSDDVICSHEACYTVMAAKNAFLLQADVDSRGAVGFTVFHVGGPDLVDQSCVGLGSLANRTLSPGVVTAL